MPWVGKSMDRKATLRRMASMCEACLWKLTPPDLEDGVTIPAECCGRTGLCRDCRQEGMHDCDASAAPCTDGAHKP